MTIVDAHLHVFVEESAQYPRDPSAYKPGFDPAPVELLLEHMDKNNIKFAIPVQPLFYAWDNNYLAECIKRYPDRLVGVGLVDPLDEDAEANFNYWCGERGLQGIRLNAAYEDNSWLQDKRQYRVWDRAAKLKTPICVQGRAQHMQATYDLARRFFEVKVVIDHMTMPDTGDAPEYDSMRWLWAMADLPNVHVKITGHYHFSKELFPYRDTWSVVEKCVRLFGPDRCLWGTDFPYMLDEPGYGKTLALTKELLPFLTDHDRQWILGGTAMKLWRFPDI